MWNLAFVVSEQQFGMQPPPVKFFHLKAALSTEKQSCSKAFLQEEEMIDYRFISRLIFYAKSFFQTVNL
jgi:hypothetical protein